METNLTDAAPPFYKLPDWAWWAIGIGIIVAVTAGVVLLVRSSRPQLPLELVQKRETVGKILEEMSRVSDVDVKPLEELEGKKDYRGAVRLMDEALKVNLAYENLSDMLLKASSDLTRLALQIKPDDLGTKAVEAFGSLASLAEVEKRFYQNRRNLYEMTRSYYADLEAEKNPLIPENLNLLVQAVNSDFSKARELEGKFAAAVKAFDDAASKK